MMEHAKANSSFLTLGDYGILKTSALIAVNVGRDAIYIEPFFH